MAKLSSPVEIITNLTASDIIGRAVVVHDSTPPGRRIACALLVAAVDGEDDVTTTTTTTTKISTGASFIATNFVKYFNSDTNFSVSGAVFMEQGTSSIPSQIVSWDLAGIDPACTGTEQGNICGIHIHEGKSCSEDALGHFFKVDVDPWVVSPSGDGAYYSAVDSNMTKLSSPLEIITNLTASDIIGRAVVVHDSTPPGRRIACALLATRSEDRTTTPRTALAGALGHQISALAVIFAAAFF
jgi:Cu/Zn superoxide dismutase